MEWMCPKHKTVFWQTEECVEWQCNKSREAVRKKALQNSAAVKRDGYFKRGNASGTLGDLNLATLSLPRHGLLVREERSQDSQPQK